VQTRVPGFYFLVVSLCLAVLWPGRVGAAQTISYTVQVAALSDQASAEGLRRNLSEAGYPAYLVSVPGEQTVYRLRVGAFGDREAAQAYADAMRGVGGTVPVPALAEGIPPDLIPLEPAFVARYDFVSDFEQLEVVPWGDAGGRGQTVALRTQGFFEAEPFIATYRVLSPELVASPFPAWRAAPVDQTTDQAADQTKDQRVVQRVANLPLFAADEADVLPEGDLTAEGKARLGEAAEALALTPEQVRPYIFYEPGRGAPFLVVAERFDPVSRTGGRYSALGNPGTAQLSAAGPRLTWFGQGVPEGFPEGPPKALFSLRTLVQGGRVVPPKTGSFGGNGWRVGPDGDFTAFSVGSRTWRAVVGQPLWAGGDYLLVYKGRQVTLYEVEPSAR